MLSVNNLDLRFGEKYLFKNISIQVHKGNRVGLVGVNGAGKTTLLKIMAGITNTDDGVVSCSKYFSIGYLAQESTEFFSERTLFAEAETAFAPLLALQAEADRLHEEMESADHESEGFQQLLLDHGEIMQQLEGSDIYSISGKIEKVLLGLGFSREDMEKPVASFSGGWQMRLKLAKMLLESPSLLLLDEPTNHLDIVSLTWVEQFLKNYKGSMVIISHDRTFLDKTCERIWELSFGKIDVYKGNYTYYTQEKIERRAIEKGAYDNQQAKIKQTMRFVDKFRAKATKARQVQSRVKQLEKMELIELSDEESQIRFRFPPAPDSGRDVLKVTGLSKTFDQQKVFSGVDLLLNRGDKVAVVGVNGAGKTTFLKIVAGEMEPDEGNIVFGANVKMTYFGQHQAQELSPQYSVLETMSFAGEDMTITRIRSLLGAFLFRGEEVDKKVAVLSGGEKSRLALAKMIAIPANCMLLDEPTNHLDMSSQDVLMEAMAQYDGTIVVVSHNRYFLDSFVNKVLEVRDGNITMFEGNITEYLTKVEELEAQEKDLKTADEKVTDNGKAGSSEGVENRKEKKRLEALKRQERSRRAGPWLKKLSEAEAQVEEFETKKEQLETKMADPSLYSDEKGWTDTSKEYEECKRHLDRWYAKWEEAQEKIDAIDLELEKMS
ncbi:ABC-F family ATP-binding cassette domain-containing protein [Desulforhopalus sp. IMCC35007]|uniref:ABC-F family ATP-binding cassette domain-containing protein n=1 Tax=Desulforhopalus sp. IMCC35007 TaxID=2569543 RepID=UPI0010AEB9A5|nr:ABC-F family ATP-binding cassette domain-containing protein [Desulforhopalus sp. IMCC35007]TKB10849.1 ABC-F family ATP-binding cassette domain-containing protein [Desulforhopalus sp. IMCC35007]